MNYSITYIFTEISFYPETSILLQIITNYSYDISDMTIKGEQSVCSGSERQNMNGLPETKGKT